MQGQSCKHDIFFLKPGQEFIALHKFCRARWLWPIAKVGFRSNAIAALRLNVVHRIHSIVQLHHACTQNRRT